jgi:hypothetical protein
MSHESRRYVGYITEHYLSIRPFAKSSNVMSIPPFAEASNVEEFLFTVPSNASHAFVCTAHYYFGVCVSFQRRRELAIADRNEQANMLYV